MTSYSIAEEIKKPVIYNYNYNKYVLVSDYNELVRDYNSCRELLVENKKVIDDCNKTIAVLGKEISNTGEWKIYLGCFVGGLAGYGLSELIHKFSK